MGIQVECPNGHAFKVKDKYAGKKGLCPHCEGQVVVQVPNAVSSEETNRAYRKAVTDDIRASHASSSVLDDTIHEDPNSSSLSLMGSSVIRHNVKCKCGQAVPMWFARCPGCGEYMQRR